MPRQYFSILLLGIVTISAVCLGLRWHVLAQLPAAGTVPAVTAQPVESTRQVAPSTASPVQNVEVAQPSAEAGSVAESNSAAEEPSRGEAAGNASSPPAATSAGSAVQGLLNPGKTQAQPKQPPARQQEFPQKPKPVRVDINRATVEQLQALPGVGPVLAQRIVDYRKQHGAFKSVAELNNVKGIGEKKLADIKPWAYLGP
jgi:competence protein ComEA